LAILFVHGVNDQSVIGVTLGESQQIVRLLDGNCAIDGQLPLKSGVAASITLVGKGVRQPGLNFTTKPTLIFNQISDADTHRGALERCAELCSQLDVPVINRPQAIMRTTRDAVYQRLQGIPGVIVPRTVRFAPHSPEAVFKAAASEDFPFPFIVRIAGKHGGKSMLRINSREDYPVLHQYPFDGRDFYLTQYVDFKDGAGIYHKQRLAVIDGEPILRHTLFDQDWSVHAESGTFMVEHGETWESYQLRSDTYENEIVPRLNNTVQEITSRLGLEYYGIDCHLSRDGEMLVFEANANMNILFNDVPKMEGIVDRIRQRIYAMLARHSGEAVC